jgi:hypothetical protein
LWFSRSISTSMKKRMGVVPIRFAPFMTFFIVRAT